MLKFRKIKNLAAKFSKLLNVSVWIRLRRFSNFSRSFFNFRKVPVRGFTLVEMIVVFAIMAILSTLAVNGYLQYRKGAVLDLSSDNFVAQFNELKEKTVQGRGGSERGAQIRSGVPLTAGTNALCHGIVIENGTASAFTQDFDSSKVWYGWDDEWTAQGCGDPYTESYTRTDFELGDDIIVNSILRGGEDEISSVIVRFYPPDGVLQIFPTATRSYENDSLEIELGYESGGASKTVEVNLLTGNANVK